MKLIFASDVGMLFLNENFTIPNFPSRLLDYLSKGKSVIAITDKTTNIGKTIIEGGFSWWNCSSNLQGRIETMNQACKLKLKVIIQQGYNGRKYLEEFYDVKNLIIRIVNLVKLMQIKR